MTREVKRMSLLRRVEWKSGWRQAKQFFRVLVRRERPEDPAKEMKLMLTASDLMRRAFDLAGVASEKETDQVTKEFFELLAKAYETPLEEVNKV